jgi:hypothetical protein
MMWLGLRARVGTRRMRRNAFLELVLTPERLAEVDREALASRLAELFGHDLADQPPVVMKQLCACARFDVPIDRASEINTLLARHLGAGG